jgi:hypothetical protein
MQSASSSRREEKPLCTTEPIFVITFIHAKVRNNRETTKKVTDIIDVYYIFGGLGNNHTGKRIF